jgi:uncharacterized protein (DUF952 family)
MASSVWLVVLALGVSLSGCSRDKPPKEVTEDSYSSPFTPSEQIPPPLSPEVNIPSAQKLEHKPKHLYKVVFLDNWNKSSGKKSLLLSAEDADFIHLATEDQLSHVLARFWSMVPKYIILRVDVEKLPGNLVYEKNPEGTVYYYHLYNGSIPIEAISDVKVVENEQQK